jgi:hypothetical protein
VSVVDTIDTMIKPIVSVVDTIDTMINAIETMINTIVSVVDTIETMINTIDTIVDAIDTMIDPTGSLFVRRVALVDEGDDFVEIGAPLDVLGGPHPRALVLPLKYPTPRFGSALRSRLAGRWWSGQKATLADARNVRPLCGMVVCKNSGLTGTVHRQSNAL